jgi:hypothetical protein
MQDFLCEIIFGNMDWVGKRNAKLFTLTKIDFFELFTIFQLCRKKFS